MKYRISVIMGIFNCEKTLDEAIESLISQTYAGWKLIMCDDGSTDKTLQIAMKYVKKDPKKYILIRNKRNRGLNYTLNHCLKYVDTEYVARMDGDDISLPERFERELKFLDNNSKYAIVSTPMIYFDENGVFNTGKQSGEPIIDQFSRGTPFCHAPCMVRTEAYVSVGGYSLKENRLRVEDWDLWIRMYEKGYRGFILDEPLYKMRDDRNAYSRRKFKYRINESLVSISAVNKLKLSRFNYLHALRPIIVGILPKPVYTYLHKRKMGT